MIILDFFISPALAADSDPSLLGSLAPLVILFAVFYFLLIRPQQKRTKEHKKLIAEIGVGDEISTAGGLCGIVTEINTSFLKLCIEKNIVVTIKRDHIAQVLPKGSLETVVAATESKPKKKTKKAVAKPEAKPAE